MLFPNLLALLVRQSLGKTSRYVALIERLVDVNLCEHDGAQLVESRKLEIMRCHNKIKCFLHCALHDPIIGPLGHIKRTIKKVNCLVSRPRQMSNLDLCIALGKLDNQTNQVGIAHRCRETKHISRLGCVSIKVIVANAPLHGRLDWDLVHLAVQERSHLQSWFGGPVDFDRKGLGDGRLDARHGCKTRSHQVEAPQVG